MLVLNALLEERDWRGRLSGNLPSVELKFAPIGEVSSAFKPMVREAAFDCGELAVVTFLQAFERGAPLALLPFVVSGRPAHRSIACNLASGITEPKQLAGRRVGIRSYSQASGMWVRSILKHEYGVVPEAIQWVTFEDAHVADFVDPPNCTRAISGASLKEMLICGDIDAAIVGSRMPEHAAIRPLIADAAAAGEAWMAKHGVWPINHMFAVSTALISERPDAVKEIFHGLKTSRDAGSSPFPEGLAGDWRALDLACAYAFEQGLVERLISRDELFAPFAAALSK
jgi:4,5-dihydroxyphthalate decarboxylase